MRNLKTDNDTRTRIEKKEKREKKVSEALRGR